MNNKKLNVQPDIPDIRDRQYSPPLRLLPTALNSAPYSDASWWNRVKDQKETEACTGFALAAMVEILAWKEWQQKGSNGQAPEPISAFMLYYFARRYDEIPEDDVNGGSTARGAMKAWFNQGACHLTLWPEIDENEKTANPDWNADAFRTPLGAYYRVDHQSISDLQAAISETGVVYVTAQIHDGWTAPSNGRIDFTANSESRGGHAFLLVGYDEAGFWIQNSWNTDWGKSGFAHLEYSDWNANGMDAWVAQLGVRQSQHVDSLSSGLDLKFLKGEEVTAKAAQTLLLSGSPTISAQQINPYIINLGNNGELSDQGKFATRVEDLRNLVTHYLQNAISQFGLGDSDIIDVAIYAHGGLTDEDAAEATARTWVPALFARKIFPIFIMWETGLWETLSDILADAQTKQKAVSGGFLDGVTDWWDERLEGLVSTPGTLEWDEMKKNAEAASISEKGGLRLLYQQLQQSRDAKFFSRLRVHLIGHSAGAIFHAYFLPILLEANLRVDSLYFMAPACRAQLFESNVLPHYLNGKVSAYTEFHLTDVAERQDNCASNYRRSLLYLVSNAFEHQRGMPLLGMEKFFGQFHQPINTPAKSGQIWDWIAAPTGKSPKAIARSNSTSHGGFSADDDTREAILERLAARSQTPIATGAGGAPISPNGRSRQKKSSGTPPLIARAQKKPKPLIPKAKSK